MGNTVSGVHLGIDTHANRPAATAVTAGALYSCSDHSLIYRSDGSTWSTWATLGGGGGGGGDLTLISETVLGSDTASVTFSSIAATYRHLLITGQVRTDRADESDGMAMQVGNGTVDGTSGNYFYDTDSSGDSSGSETSSTDTDVKVGRFSLCGGNADTGAFGHYRIEIMSYRSTGEHKAIYASVNAFPSASRYRRSETQGRWGSTSAIDIITLTPRVGSNFAAGSVFSLYGLG